MLLALGLLFGLPDALRAGDRRDVVIEAGSEELPLTVILPEGYAEDAEVPYPLVLALPPGGGTPAMVDAFLGNYWIEEADRRGHILVSPAVLGTELEARGRTVLDAVFGWVEEHLHYDPERVTLTGQSNGGLGAFYLARMEPARFQAVVVMPGGHASNGELTPLVDKPVLLLVGELDPDWVELGRHTEGLLKLAGAHPVLEIVPGGTHVFSYSAKTLFDWIESHFPE